MERDKEADYIQYKKDSNEYSMQRFCNGAQTDVSEQVKINDTAKTHHTAYEVCATKYCNTIYRHQQEQYSMSVQHMCNHRQ